MALTRANSSPGGLLPPEKKFVDPRGTLAQIERFDKLMVKKHGARYEREKQREKQKGPDENIYQTINPEDVEDKFRESLHQPKGENESLLNDVLHPRLRTPLFVAKPMSSSGAQVLLEEEEKSPGPPRKKVIYEASYHKPHYEKRGEKPRYETIGEKPRYETIAANVVAEERKKK